MILVKVVTSFIFADTAGLMIRALRPFTCITVQGVARSSRRAAIFSTQLLVPKQPRNFASTIGAALCGRRRDVPEIDVMSNSVNSANEEDSNSQATGIEELKQDREGEVERGEGLAKDKGGEKVDTSGKPDEQSGLIGRPADVVAEREGGGDAAKVGGSGEVEGRENEGVDEEHKRNGSETATGTDEVEDDDGEVNKLRPPEGDENPPTGENKTPPPKADKTPPPEADKTPPPGADKTPLPEADKTPPPGADKTPLPEADKTPPPEKENDRSSPSRAIPKQHSLGGTGNPPSQGGGGGFFSTPFGYMKRWFSQEPKRDRQYWESLSLEEKRKFYRCGQNYVTLDNIETWEEWRKGMKPPKKRPSSSPYPPDPLLNQKVSVWQGDITTLEIGAIVNAANSSLLGGGGVDGAIHRAASSSLRDECATLNGCSPGDAKITSGHRLPAKYILHTVGPMNVSERTLRSCYECCLQLALENEIRSVAFSCIATGVYGYPNEAAAHVALETTRRWLEEHADKVDRVIFCVFLNVDLNIYSKLLSHYFPGESSEGEGEGEEEGEEEVGEEEEGDSMDEGTPTDKEEEKKAEADDTFVVVDTPSLIPSLGRSVTEPTPPTSGKEGSTKLDSKSHDQEPDKSHDQEANESQMIGDTSKPEAAAEDTEEMEVEGQTPKKPKVE